MVRLFSLVTALSSWFLCPFDLSSQFFKHFFTFCRNKIFLILYFLIVSPGLISAVRALLVKNDTVVKNPPANAGGTGDMGSSPGKIPWEKMATLPVYLLGKFHGQRSLVGCNLWGCKELTQLSDWVFRRMCARMHARTHTHTHTLSVLSAIGISLFL